jgi:hypothetical protein
MQLVVFMAHFLLYFLGLLVNLVVSLLSSVPLATLRLIVLHDRLHAIFFIVMYEVIH